MGCWVIWGSCCSVPCGLDPPDSLYNFIMIEKGSPKSTTGRMALILPTKNISIKTFFNEKLSNEHSITYLHCSNSSFRNQYNIIQNRYKISSFTPQSAHYNHSFIQGLSSNSKINKYSRKLTSSVRFIGKMRRKSLIATASVKSQINKEQQVRSVAGYLSKNKLLGRSGIEMVRKQLQMKFNKTRIILREQQKMQKYQRVQSIYENRYRLRSRSKNVESDNLSRESNQYCSPWNRVKLEGLDTIAELENKQIQIIQ